MNLTASAHGESVKMTEAVAAYTDVRLAIGRKVTRCRDCRFYSHKCDYSPSGDGLNTVGIGHCCYFDATVTDDGFCAWGRKDG